MLRGIFSKSSAFNSGTVWEPSLHPACTAVPPLAGEHLLSRPADRAPRARPGTASGLCPQPPPLGGRPSGWWVAAVGEAASSCAHSGPGVGDVISCPWRKSRNMGASKACPAMSTPQELALLTQSASIRGGKLPGGVIPGDRRPEGGPSLPAPCAFPQGRGRRPAGPVNICTLSRWLLTTFCTRVPWPCTSVWALSCHPLPLDSQIPAPSDALRS